MASENFTSPSSSSYSWTCPADQNVTIRMWGASGGHSTGAGDEQFDTSWGGSGGTGGYVEIEYHLNEGETIDIWVGGGGQWDTDGSGGSGGVGYVSGGSGGSDPGSNTAGGGGGGATAVEAPNGSLIGSAGGGGGAGGQGSVGDRGAGGGGGARGGNGGQGQGGIHTVKTQHGADAGGSGAGGDGGDGGLEYGIPGEDGGDGGYIHSLGTLLSGSTGGGHTADGVGDGEVEIVYNNPPNGSPSNLTATSNGTTSIDLSWVDNSSNEDGFYIRRGESGGSLSRYDTEGPNTTTYTDSNISAGTTYYYEVVSYNGDVTSSASNEVSSTPGFVVNVWDGGEFVDGIVKYYNGTSWTNPSNIKLYDGSSWKDT